MESTLRKYSQMAIAATETSGVAREVETAAAEAAIAMVIGCMSPDNFGVHEASNVTLRDVTPGGEQGNVNYRGGVDGSFAGDNSGIAMTLATMIEDCEAGRLSCDEGLEFVSIAGPDEVQPFFADYAAVPVNQSGPGAAGGQSVPSFVLFKQTYAEAVSHRWAPYATVKHPLQRSAENLTYVSVDLSTLDNPRWGIKANYRVKATFFESPKDGLNYPVIFPQDRPQLLQMAFSFMYAPVVETMARGAAVILKTTLRS